MNLRTFGIVLMLPSKTAQTYLRNAIFITIQPDMILFVPPFSFERDAPNVPGGIPQEPDDVPVKVIASTFPVAPNNILVVATKVGINLAKIVLFIGYFPIFTLDES